MTKEAKLSAAMRIVPEWRLYDEEVRGLQARVRRGLYQHADSDQVTVRVWSTSRGRPQIRFSEVFVHSERK